jgi:anti-sigma factor RsiW
MNITERELKLQAYLDGELPAAEAAEVERWLDQDAQMLALSTELKQTKAALKSGEVEVKCPETREFYWSKIARSIEAEERQVERTATSRDLPWWRKLMLPVGALAALAVTVTMLQTVPQGPHAVPSQESAQIAKAISEVEQLEESMGAITYSDSSEGVTVVWHYDRSSDI